MNRVSHPLFGLAIALAVGAWSSWPVLDGRFMYDDERLIVSNPVAHGLSHLRENLTTDYFDAGDGARLGYYRPVTKLGFLLEYAAFGANPRGYHAVSLGVFMLTIASLAWLLRLVEVSPPLAALVLLLYASHPALGEPVGLVAAQSDLLAIAGLLLGLAGYVQHRRRGGAFSLLLAVVGEALALGSKEIGLVLLGLVLAWELGQIGTRRQRMAALWLLPPIAVYGWLRSHFGVLPIQRASLSPSDMAISTATMAWRIAARAFAPLAYEPYAHMTKPAGGGLALSTHVAGSIFVLGLVAYLFVRVPRARLALACCFLPLLVPALGASHIHTTDDVSLLVASDRWVLPCVIGAAWLSVLAGEALFAHALRSPELRWVGLAALPILIAAQAVTARGEVMGHTSLEASTLALADKLQAAADDSSMAREVYAARDAILVQRNGSPEQIIAAYRQLLALQPGHFGRHYDLAIVLARAGQLDEAFEHAWIAFYGVSPDGSQTFGPEDSLSRDRAGRACFLARLLELRGDRVGARRHFELCAQIDPSQVAARERARVLSGSGAL